MKTPMAPAWCSVPKIIIFDFFFIIFSCTWKKKSNSKLEFFKFSSALKR